MLSSKFDKLCSCLREKHRFLLFAKGVRREKRKKHIYQVMESHKTDMIVCMYMKVKSSFLHRPYDAPKLKKIGFASSRGFKS